MREWLERIGVRTLFIEPGSPWDSQKDSRTVSWPSQRRSLNQDRKCWKIAIFAVGTMQRLRPHP